MVVTITITTTAENDARSMTGWPPHGQRRADVREDQAYLAARDHADADRPRDRCARPVAPSEQACLPRIAATVSAAASTEHARLEE